MLLGAISLLALASPDLRVHLQPGWAVAASGVSAVITGVGLWRQRRWAIVFFLVTWVAQVVVIVALGLQMRWGYGLGGLVVLVGFGIAYWRKLR